MQKRSDVITEKIQRFQTTVEEVFGIKDQMGKERANTTQEGIDRLQVGLGENADVIAKKLQCLQKEAKDVRVQLEEMHQLTDSSAAGSQSSGGRLNSCSR